MISSAVVKLNNQYVPWLISLAVVAVAAFALFGFTGFRTIIAFAILFIIPLFLLLRKTSLDAEEKIFFSLFIGLGLFPLLAWSVNQLLPSFRLSVVVAFVLVAAVGLFAQRILKKQKVQSQ